MALPQSPPPASDLLFKGPGYQDRIARVVRAGIGPCVGDRYRHWDSLRRLKPPPGFTHEEWWAAIWLARTRVQRDLPLPDRTGKSFVFVPCDPLWRHLSELDRDLGGRLVDWEEIRDPASRERHLFSALAEEAIRSSQLEGAATTRKVAADMLRSGRRPRTADERMIVNNFRAMEFVRAHKADPLSPPLILDLHAIIMDGTLEAEGAPIAGRLRRPEEHVVVEALDSREVVHLPPAADSLAGRLETLCAFANGAAPEDYLHPIARAILLHFALAYDHPFVDGNGRTARALFYWGLLHGGYPLAEFLSVSPILKKAPARYASSFLFTETDGGDTTYFVLHQLGVLRRAVEALHAHLTERRRELEETRALLVRSREFNHRQIALLGHALRDPQAVYTVRSHSRSHGVVLQTARTDLVQLQEAGLLVGQRSGRQMQFRPAPALEVRCRTGRRR